MLLDHSPRHAAALAWAQKQVGQHEIPPGSNTGPFVTFCQRATWLAGTGWAWCRAFTLRARKEAGDTPADGSAGAWDALDRARARGEALTPAQFRKAIPGDEVVWNIGAGHASILRAFEKRADSWHVRTIDGNVGNAVQECVRPLSLVRGFIHWPEPAPTKAKAKTPPKPQPPRAQVVGSASGKRKLVSRAGRRLPLPPQRVNVDVDGRRRNTRQLATNPALLKRIGDFIRKASTVTIRRSA